MLEFCKYDYQPDGALRAQDTCDEFLACPAAQRVAYVCMHPTECLWT